MIGWKVAVTLCAAVIATVQVVAVPVQLPVQPVKRECSAGEKADVLAYLNQLKP